MDHAAERHRFTADQVLQMVEAGVLAEDEPVELLDGELIRMSPQGPRHAGLTAVIHRLLDRAAGPDAHVRDHSPVDGGPWSLPEPDLAVVRGGPADYLTRHPAAADLLLVVEISVTSQAADRRKIGIYAQMGVSEYWWLDLAAGRLRVHRDPDPAVGDYARVEILRAGEQVPVGRTTLDVRELLCE